MKTLWTLILCTFISYFSLLMPAQAATNPDNESVIVTQMVSINHADLNQLSTLRGIGEKKAMAILNYRQKNGKFDSIDALLNVKGIGQKILNDNKLRLIM
jgi:competence protein ComEA